MADIQLFNFAFPIEPKMEEEFQKFFKNYGLLPLFTNEHRAPGIRVSLAEVQSVLKDGEGGGKEGAYFKVFKEFGEIITIAKDNKSYEEAMFKVIYESRSIQGLSNKLRRLMNEFDNMPEEYQHNRWNVVWYTKKIS